MKRRILSQKYVNFFVKHGKLEIPQREHPAAEPNRLTFSHL